MTGAFRMWQSPFCLRFPSTRDGRLDCGELAH